MSVSARTLIPEDADNAAVVATLLAGAVGIEIPECDRVDTVAIAIETTVVVRREFFEPIRRGGGFRVRLVDRQRLRVAVDRGAGREDDASGRLSSGLKDGKMRVDVHCTARLGIVDGLLDADLSRFVEDHVGVGDRVSEGFIITDIRVDERDVLRGVGSRARQEVVIDGNSTVAGESVNEMVADESRTAGDERMIEIKH